MTGWYCGARPGELDLMDAGCARLTEQVTEYMVYKAGVSYERY